jgi:hypothetical protein
LAILIGLQYNESFCNLPLLMEEQKKNPIKDIIEENN